MIKPQFLPTLSHARLWYLVDAEGLILGRMATKIASLLMGKKKPIYHPADDVGDYVVVVNAKKIALTGRKPQQKIYRHHTGYPGGLKEITFQELLEKNPGKIIERTVSGMLPKNNLRHIRLERLLVFPTAQHPYEQNIFEKVEMIKKPDILKLNYRQRIEIGQGLQYIEELTQKGLNGENVEGVPLDVWTKLNSQKA